MVQEFDLSKLEDVRDPVTGEVVARCRVLRCSHCGGEFGPKRIRWEGSRAHCPNTRCNGVGIDHDLCPKNTLWRRGRTPEQITRVEVRCTNCSKVWGANAAKGVPLRCDFCGVVGVVEKISREETEKEERR